MEKEMVNKGDAHELFLQKDVEAQLAEDVVCGIPDDDCSIRRMLLEYALLELHRKRKVCIEKERRSRFLE